MHLVLAERVQVDSMLSRGVLRILVPRAQSPEDRNMKRLSARVNRCKIRGVRQVSTKCFIHLTTFKVSLP